MRPQGRLSKRLLAAARYVRPGERVADIGCGDASLAVYLALEKGCRVIATEASLAGFGIASQRVAASGAPVEVRRGWGLAPLRPGEVGVIIIAGMGGITIAQVLEARPPGVAPRYFVLQPMERSAFLRVWLYQHRWAVLDEDLVEEKGRIYEILVARPGPAPASEADEPPLAGGEVGRILVNKRHPLLPRLLAQKQQRYRRQLAEAGRSPRAEEARQKAKEVLAELERLAASLKLSPKE